MLQNDLKIALRNLRNNGSYTLIHVTGLSLGITSVIMIFLFLQHHSSSDRHHVYFERIFRVVVNLHLDEGIEYGAESSLAMANVLAEDFASVEKTAFIRKLPGATLSALKNGRTERFIEKENVVFANQSFMEMFAFDWISPNAASSMTEPYTVVVTEGAAEKYFGTANAVGKVLRLSNVHDLRVTGVVKKQMNPTDFGFDFYISLPTLLKTEPSYEVDNFGWLSGRNQTFVMLADREDAVRTENLLKENGKKYYGENARYYEHLLQPLKDVHFDERYGGKIRREILWVLAFTGAFLLFIACVNFVNLATAQAARRAKEIGVRKVLGGTRQQLFIQFISETAVLAVLSFLISLLMTAMLLPGMNDLVSIDIFRFSMLFQIQIWVFWLTLIPVVILAAGFYPAVIISGFNPVVALKGRLISQHTGGIGIRRILIVTQLVMAQVLVIGTLVLLLQLNFFKNADLGFDQNAVLTIPLPKIDPGVTLTKALKNELLRYPDVSSVTYQYEAPTSTMGYGGSVRFDNRTEWEKFVIRDRFGDEDYLQTYKMSLLAGRNITGRDSVTEFVVNEELVKKLGIVNPVKILGKQLEDGNSGLKGEIVGVVKSFHLKSLQTGIEPCVIFARPALYKEVAVKLQAKDVAASLKAIRKAWMKTYPDEVFSYQLLDEQIARFYEKEQQLTDLIRTFTLVAIFICVLGLYGMISFMVTQKTKEIGVRKILGAGMKSILMLFGKEFLLLVLVACAISVPLSWFMMKTWLEGFAYRIDLEWWIPAMGGLTIFIITLLTVGQKVIKAAYANPVKALRSE